MYMFTRVAALDHQKEGIMSKQTNEPTLRQ